jgi:hypothetical protein
MRASFSFLQRKHIIREPYRPEYDADGDGVSIHVLGQIEASPYDIRFVRPMVWEERDREIPPYADWTGWRKAYNSKN